MGFGHRVYKNYDPRAKLMRETCHEVLDELGLHDDPLFKLAMALEKIALEDEYFVARKLYPNVDFYSGIVQRAIGIPVALFTAIFALARTVGWIAQLNEMIGDPEYKIGRPRQLYIGAARARRQADRQALSFLLPRSRGSAREGAGVSHAGALFLSSARTSRDGRPTRRSHSRIESGGCAEQRGDRCPLQLLGPRNMKNATCAPSRRAARRRERAGAGPAAAAAGHPARSIAARRRARIGARAAVGAHPRADATYVRATAAGAHVVELPAGTSPEAAAAVARRLAKKDPAVRRVEIDRRMVPHAEPVPAPSAPIEPTTLDSFSHHQWPLMARAPGRAGRANFHGAWQRTTGAAGVVVAVLDSGTTHHPDTVSRELGGFDMVSDVALSADGGDRDADPTDPGDFCANGSAASDWHGTAAAG